MNKLVLLILLSLCCCKQKLSNTEISKINFDSKQLSSIQYISFSEYNASVPANFELHVFESIDAGSDSIFSKKHTYKKGVWNKTEILKAKPNKEDNAEFFNLILKENSLNNKTFGQLGDDYDGGEIEVNLTTNNNELIAI
ncbi:MAG: hypothetical protein ACTIJ9_11105 [Aequorivita sp.]